MHKPNESETLRSGSQDRNKRDDGNRDPFSVPVIIITAAAGIYLLYEVFRSIAWPDFSGVAAFSTVFTSILMQAFPFMLIGVLVSAALHVFVPDGWLIRVFPQKHGLGFLSAMFAGIFFPVCECAIVPVMTSLVKKGVSPAIALTFMLSAPIINPIVIISTLYAFPGQPEFALYRVCFGLVIALLAGLVVLAAGKTKTAVLLPQKGGHEHGGYCEHCAHAPVKFSHKLRALFLHAGDEFFEVGKYLVIGAFFTSLARVLVPETAFKSLEAQNALSLFIMMAAAFVFSACSTSDAFIARSFVNKMSAGAIMGFLVFGPMMDIKNMLMLFANFKKSFVLKLSVLILVLNFAVLYVFAYLLL